MSTTGAFNPDDVIAQGLSNYATFSRDQRDAVFGARFYQTVSEPFRQNIGPEDTTPLAFLSMIMRPDIRTNCFVAVTSSLLIVAWKKGLIKKTTDSEIIALGSITEASIKHNSFTNSPKATVMHVQAGRDVKFALPVGRPDIATMIRGALLAHHSI